MNRITDHIAEATHLLWHTEAHRHVKDLFRKFNCAFHLGAATGQDDAGSDHVFAAATTQFVANQAEQFFVARLYNFSQRLTGQPARRAVTHARHFDGFIEVGQLRQRAGVLDLDLFRVLGRRTHREWQCHW